MRVLPVNLNQNIRSSNSSDRNKSNVAFGMNTKKPADKCFILLKLVRKWGLFPERTNNQVDKSLSDFLRQNAEECPDLLGKLVNRLENFKRRKNNLSATFTHTPDVIKMPSGRNEDMGFYYISISDINHPMQKIEISGTCFADLVQKALKKLKLSRLRSELNIKIKQAETVKNLNNQIDNLATPSKSN